MLKFFEVSLIVPESYDGFRVDSLLAKCYPQYSRNQWIEWLKAGLIFHQGKALSPKNKCLTEQLIEGQVPINTPQTEAMAQDIPLDIIYEDEHLLVINKPAGLTVHPGAGQKDMTLMNALLYHQENLSTLPRAGIVHRLDKDTTGLMVIAKTSACYQALIQMMQNREIQREYLALVHGQVISGGHIHTHFGRHPKQRLKMAVLKQGREAITHYQIEQAFKDFTLLRVRLETGRTHQIRVHLQHIGYPIIGDKLYGKNCAKTSKELALIINSFPRQALHAFSLKFTHPITQKPLIFSADITDDLANLIGCIHS